MMRDFGGWCSRLLGYFAVLHVIITLGFFKNIHKNNLNWFSTFGMSSSCMPYPMGNHPVEMDYMIVQLSSSYQL